MKLTLLSPTVPKLDKMRDAWRKDIGDAIEPGDLEAAWALLSKQKRYLPGQGLLGSTPELDALLTGAIVRPVGFLAQWLLALAMALAAISYRLWRIGKSRRLDAVVLPLAVVAYLSVMVVLYARFGLLVDGLYHLAAFIVTWWVLAALEKRWSHATP
jgi:hypothetical protein